MNRMETLKSYNNFWKYDFEHYNLWCFALDKKSCKYDNLKEYKEFLRELEDKERGI